MVDYTKPNDDDEKITTLQQPDADRSAWQLKKLNYDETVALLKGTTKVEPQFALDDQVLDKIRNDKPDIGSDEDLNAVIEDKYQQILLARYNADQDDNVTTGQKNQQNED